MHKSIMECSTQQINKNNGFPAFSGFMIFILFVNLKNNAAYCGFFFLILYNY